LAAVKVAEPVPLRAAMRDANSSTSSPGEAQAELADTRHSAIRVTREVVRTMREL
jgi:hypothetical protein